MIYDSRDYIGYIFIDSGKVFASTSEQHSLIVYYDLGSNTLSTIVQTYEPTRMIAKDAHRIVSISGDFREFHGMYGEIAFMTASGDVIVFTPGGFGIFLLEI